jgi:hypothetical protein
MLLLSYILPNPLLFPQKPFKAHKAQACFSGNGVDYSCAGDLLEIA